MRRVGSAEEEAPVRPSANKHLERTVMRRRLIVPYAAARLRRHTPC
jgi:hypothetical protein